MGILHPNTVAEYFYWVFVIETVRVLFSRLGILWTPLISFIILAGLDVRQKKVLANNMRFMYVSTLLERRSDKYSFSHNQYNYLNKTLYILCNV